MKAREHKATKYLRDARNAAISHPSYQAAIEHLQAAQQALQELATGDAPAYCHGRGIDADMVAVCRKHTLPGALWTLDILLACLGNCRPPEALRSCN